MAGSGRIAPFHALVQSIGHKFAVESGATLHAGETVSAITYRHDLIHPWPKEFAYRVELFTQQEDAANIVRAAQKALGSEAREHVVNVFTGGRAAIKAACNQFGYQLAWTNVLMSKKLSPTTTVPPDIAEIRPISTAQDVEAINTLEPETPSSARAIDDPSLHDFVGLMDGAIVAKTEMVTVYPGIGYVSDICTRLDSRRKGREVRAGTPAGQSYGDGDRADHLCTWRQGVLPRDVPLSSLRW